ncbi:MAG: cyanophycin synthetase family protein [Eggerthellaceae bacterium]
MDEGLHVEKLSVGKGRLSISLTIARSENRYMNHNRADIVASYFPDLLHHVCVNNAGDTFGDIIETTSVPHLFEHLVIQFQTEETEDDSAVFVGNTQWVDEENGRARVQVNFLSDFEALQAVSEATRFINTILLSSN